MKRMLFNATQAEELRVAIVDGQKLIDLDIESASKEQKKSNIYKGIVTRVEPSLEAAFVDYGAERHGFLPFKEISRAYFKEGVEASKARIQDAIREGQEIIVQVEKDERGNKGAALTTFVSLAGRYLVLMPNNPRGGGVSRRVEGDDRAELRDALDQVEVPAGMSLIARTAAIGRTTEELQWDLNYLAQLWKAIDGASGEQKGAFLIYQEGSLVIRAIRDYFSADIGELLIDTDDIYEQAKQFMAHVMPANVHRVKRYRDDVPLFSRFQIEHQIESAYSRQVTLPSGGAIVIDHTEALVSVDVNSGRATRGADIEETALKTNLEAADEVARQLRLRDLGGLIVIDFIDMENPKSQREVENRLRDALRHDRARVQTGKISRFGLLELSRQRLRPALAETSYITCPRCTGTGHIRSTESAALHILRIVEEEGMKDNTGAVHVQVPVDVATFLLNEKRDDIAKIEQRHKVTLLIIPNRHLETPAHDIVRLRHDQLNLEDTALPSYKMAVMPENATYIPPSGSTEAKPQRIEAAIRNFTPDTPAPIVEPKPEQPVAAAEPKSVAGPGLFQRILAWFRGDEQETAPAPAPVAEPAKRSGRTDRNRSERHRGERGEGRTRDEKRGENRARDDKRSEKAEESTQGNRGERSRGERANRGERGERGERAQVAKSEALETQKPAREPGETRERKRERNDEGRAERQDKRELATPEKRETEAGEPARERTPRPPREPRPPRDRQARHAAAAAEAAESNAPETILVDLNESAPEAPVVAAPESEGSSRRRNRRGRRGGERGERRGEILNSADGPVETVFYPTPEAAEAAHLAAKAVAEEAARAAAEAAEKVRAEVERIAHVEPAFVAAPEPAPVVVPDAVATAPEAVAVEKQAAAVEIAIPAEAPVSIPAPAHTPEPVEVLEAVETKAATAPVVEASSASTPEVVAAPAPERVATRTEAAASKPVSAQLDLLGALGGEDLVMIETQARSLPQQTATTVAETPAPARPRRARQTRTATEEVMLEQVETRN